MKRKSIFLSFIFVLLFISGCDNGINKTTKNNTIKVNTTTTSKNISFMELNAYDVTLNENETFNITVENAIGTVTFLSDNNEVATVNNGTITGVKKGTTTIKVITETETLEVKVTVNEKLKEGVNFYLNKEISTIYTGYQKELSPKLIKGNIELNPEDYELTYSVSNSDCVDITAGIITALSIGEAKVIATVKVDGVTYRAETKVVVKSMDVIEILNDNINLSVTGDYNKKTVEAKYLIANSDNYQEVAKSFTFSSLNEEIATVNENGVITGISAGTATITVSASGVTSKVNVRVYDYYNIIHTAYEFQDITNHLNGYFELGNDIDFKGLSFTPIAIDALSDTTKGFNGTINGNGYTVKNITHDKADNRSIVCVLLENGSIYNINFENIVLPNTRAARSAGVVWSNFGTVKNVKISLSTNGTGSSVNEWGFGGIVSANRSTGLTKNCVVSIVDNTNGAYTGSIFNVNQGGAVINNIAYVTSLTAAAYTHTGSYGSFYNNKTVDNIEDLNRYLNEFKFDSEYWTLSKVSLPSLKNDGSVVLTKEYSRLVSSTEEFIIDLDVVSGYYYNNENVKTYLELTKLENSTKINNLSIVDGINYLYVNTNDSFYQITVNGITAYINSLEDLDKLSENNAGFYVLTTDLDLGTLSSSKFDVFNGLFDLNGHKLTYAYADAHYIRLFNKLDSNAVIKNGNFVLTGSGAGNKAGQAGLAQENYGLIENCFFDITFLNVGQGPNDAAQYTKSGIVNKNAGTIRNTLVKVTYTGTGVIDNTKGALLAVACTNDKAGKVENVGVVFVATKTESSTVAILRNYGTSSNVEYQTSESQFVSKYESFKANGFNESDVFSLTDNGITFYGNTIINKFYKKYIKDKGEKDEKTHKNFIIHFSSWCSYFNNCL